jgi:predicted porin
MGALRLRSVDMKSWIDYEFIAGNEQNESRSDVQFPGARLISPHGQFRQQHSLNGWHRFNESWSLGTELTYGRQDGDGKPETVDVLRGPGFDGAHWWGLNAVLTYQYRKDLAFSTRAERFSDPQGYALPSAAEGDVNAVTAGLRYDFNRHVSLRPELRYDWFEDRSGARPFGNGRHLNQFTATAQMLVYF